MSNISSESNEIDITPMLMDINKVLKGHLTTILGPMINEKNAIRNILLNMPYVQKLKSENSVLQKNIIQLKTELNVLKQYYDKQLENASKKNVKLEVRDAKSGTPKTPSKIVELKQEMWRTNTKLDSNENSLSGYDGLYDEDEDDEDEDDMSEYEECNRCEKMNNIDLLNNGSCLKCLSDEKTETKNITLKKLNNITKIDENGMSASFCETILNSQKAGEQATIDTDEDECVSADTERDLVELTKDKVKAEQEEDKEEEDKEEEHDDEEDDDEEDDEGEDDEEEEEEEEDVEEEEEDVEEEDVEEEEEEEEEDVEEEEEEERTARRRRRRDA